MSSAICFDLDQSKILSSGKGLNNIQQRSQCFPVYQRYLTPYHTIPTFNDPTKRPFENIVGKRENAGK